MAPNENQPTRESTSLDEAVATEAPAARKRAPRRSTRKQAAPATDPEAVAEPGSGGQLDTGDQSATLEQQLDTGDQTEAKPARKRATRKKAAAVAPPTHVAAQAESSGAPMGAGDTPDAHADAQTGAEAGAAAARQAEPEPEPEPAGPAPAVLPAVPSFSVLFQAPEPAAASRRRGRRAQPERAEHAEPAETPTETPAAAQPEAEGAATEASAEEAGGRARRRRGGKGRRGRSGDHEPEETSPSGAAEGAERAEAGKEAAQQAGTEAIQAAGEDEEEGGTSRRRRRRRRAGSASDEESAAGSGRGRSRGGSDEPVGVKGSTRLEAKKQRRREGREAGRRRTVITEAEFLARREAVDRVMVVRNKNGRTQMGVLEDGVLVEHYIDQATNVSMAGNIYLGRIQNVLPSMEAAFVDIGKGRNAVLYAGEVNWDAAGLDANQPKRIENALESGQTVLVQVTKDPIGHKGARLTSQISLPGRYLVYVPNSSMTGISRKLPDTERARLKKILREVVPDHAGVIVRTAAEGASETELRADVERLAATWDDIKSRAEAAATPKAGKSKGRKKNGGSGSSTSGGAPMLLHGEPDLTVRVIRDVFNEDFKQLIVSGEQAWAEIHPYITTVAPDLADRVSRWTGTGDLFAQHRIDEQLAKAMDRKVWLPSGGSLVIDRTEAMTVIDVNTGKFIGSGGNLEETVTKNNIEAAEEIVRQLRLRDIGGIIVVDFIDMVLESNRELVVRRLLECLGRDRTKHQVAEVTSLGLVQMTRKRVGSGLIEVFSETCDCCNGRGFIIHTDPVDKGAHPVETGGAHSRRGRRGADGSGGGVAARATETGGPEAAEAAPEDRPAGPTAAQIAAAAHAAAVKGPRPEGADEPDATVTIPQDEPDEVVVEQESEPQRPPAAPATEPARAPEHAAGEPATAPEQPAAEPSATPEPAVGEPAVGESASSPAPEQEPVAPPARRTRHRGRVVAPAGPPGASHATLLGAEDATLP